MGWITTASGNHVLIGGDSDELKTAKDVLDFWKPYHDKVDAMMHGKNAGMGQGVNLKAMHKEIQKDHPNYRLKNFTHDAETVIKEVTPTSSTGHSSTINFGKWNAIRL